MTSTHIADGTIGSAVPAAIAAVFIKRAGVPDAAFVEVGIFAGDTVARLVKRACAKLLWRGSVDRVKLFLVPAEREDNVDAGDDASEALVLSTRPLSSIKALSAVGVHNRSCLLVRLPDPPAAAPGECAHSTFSLLLCSSSWMEP